MKDLLRQEIYEILKDMKELSRQEIFFSARLRRSESACMADIMQRFTEQKNLMKI